jgi:addiction module HigA family antidote
MTHYDPITPGEYLNHEFLEPLGISQSKLARDLDVPISRINGILKGTRTITTDTACRLGQYFNTSPEMWLNLQIQYDLQIIKKEGWLVIQSRIRPLEYRDMAT